VTSGNTQNAGRPDLGSASENKTRRRGGRATELTAGHAEILAGYAAGLARTALAEQTLRTYLSRVRQYLAWLAGDAVALDVDDVRLSARTGELVVCGKGGKVRTVPVAVPLRKPLQDWLDERRTWPGTSDTKALFLNRRGGRLSARGASDVFTAIAENAGLDEPATAHVGRHTFINELIRGGEDLVLVAELAGHARLETLRLYSQPSEADKQNALRHLPVDR
jgi:integrase/recombinase XerC